MTMIVIGSAAANAILGDEKWRRPKDIDSFTDLGIQGLEYRDTGIPLDTYWDDMMYTYFGKQERWATLDELYTIKLSHIFWEGRNGKWNLHAQDLMALKREGAVVIESLYKMLYGVWEKKFGKKVVDLDMDKADFFDDAVPRDWDHDSVHYSVAYGDHPLYEDFLSGEIMMDMKRVWSAPLETQIKLFREEIFATALERKIIPNNYRYSPGAAYLWALRRVITSLTKGNSARFIAENLDKFWEMEVDYVQRHKDNAHLLIRHKRKGQV